MGSRRWLVIGVAALAAAGPAVPGSQAAARPPVHMWSAPAANLSLTVTEDGPRVSDGRPERLAPLAVELGDDGSLAALEQYRAAKLAAATKSGRAEVASDSAAVDVMHPRPGIETVADIDGDGVLEVAHQVRSSDHTREWFDVRSGRTGAQLWRRELTPGTWISTGDLDGPAVLLFEQREESTSGLLDHRRDLVLTIEALGASGDHLWRTELRGTATSGPLGRAVTDVPILESVGDVRGDGATDVVVSLANHRPELTDIVLPGHDEVAFAVLDGRDGSMTRGPSIAASRAFEVMGDLDGDGKGDVFEHRRAHGTDAMAVLGGDGVERWVASEPYSSSNPWALGVADLDGDGDADLLSYRSTSSCGPSACTDQSLSSARDGETGDLLREWHNSYPRVAGQADGDAAVEVMVAEVVYEREEGVYGVVIHVEDLRGHVNHHTERRLPVPESPWSGFLNLIQEGDVDADSVVDWSWQIGRYYYAEPTVIDDEGRISGADGSPLPAVAGDRRMVLIAPFDGSGDDYLTGDYSTEGVVRYHTHEGFDGDALWTSPGIARRPYEGGYPEAGDLDGDGRHEVLVRFLEFGPAPREYPRLTLLDGATGSVLWDVVVDPPASV